MLHTIAHRLCLQKLGCVQKRSKLTGILVGLRQVVEDLAVCHAVSLVHFHHTAENISVLFRGDSVNRLLAGEGLEAKLTQITEELFSVFSKGLITVPNLPIVGIAIVFISRIQKVSAGTWRRRNIGNIRTQFLHQLRYHVFINSKIALHKMGMLVQPVDIHLLHLIVAADQGKGGVVTYSSEIIEKLCLKVGLHLICGAEEYTGNHHILKDHDAQFITGIEEGIPPQTRMALKFASRHCLISLYVFSDLTRLRTLSSGI